MKPGQSFKYFCRFSFLLYFFLFVFRLSYYALRFVYRTYSVLLRPSYEYCSANRYHWSSAILDKIIILIFHEKNLNLLR